MRIKIWCELGEGNDGEEWWEWVDGNDVMKLGRNKWCEENEDK